MPGDFCIYGRGCLLAAVPVADPDRRHQRRPVSNAEIASPIRTPDYAPPERLYREVSPGHVVQVWGPEWEKERERAEAEAAALASKAA